MVLAGVLGLAAISAVPSVAESAALNTPATEPISPGTLHLNSVGAVAFGTVAITGYDQDATASTTIDLTDATGSGDGWDVTLAAPALSYTTSSGTTDTLAYADLASTSALSPDSSGEVIPGTFSQVTNPIAMSASPVVIASDTDGAGSGNFTADISQPIASSAAVGTYAATWTVTISQSPATLGSAPAAAPAATTTTTTTTVAATTTTTTTAPTTTTTAAPTTTTTTTAPTTTTTTQQFTVTFGYTGASATWTVPSGVTSIDATLSGGGGGNAFTNSVTTGGPAGTVSAVLPVNAGEVLDIYVAGQGGFGNPNSAGTFSPGGWGYTTGGDGTLSSAQVGMEGGGGGGSSAIATANGPAVVAGGGGGGASTMQTCSSAVWYYWALPPNGPNGTTGQASSTADGWVQPATGGAGATQSAPGQGPIGIGSGGGPGTLGNGGSADYIYDQGDNTLSNNGGGGGAGYYGGAAGFGSPYNCLDGAGEGAIAAGGGGSSWAEATATGVSYGSQSTPANGQVSITYTN